MKYIWLVAVLVLFNSCKKEDNDPVINNPTTAGLSYAVSDSNFSTTYANLRSALQSNSDITIVAEVNHTANAQNENEDLRNTRLIIFGNPALGTPLMQLDQLAGLDLPQKMLVYEDRDGNVFAAYNSTAYLSARHQVTGASSIQQINSALNTFAFSATGGTVSENSSASISNHQGVFTSVSQNDFITTYNKLRNAISDDPNLTIISEVNHQSNAQSEGLFLNPTRLIIFGDANLETSLLKSSQTAGIDLPQKMLVWEEEDGTVNISYNNPEYIGTRHSITDNAENIAAIKNILVNMAADASN